MHLLGGLLLLQMDRVHRVVRQVAPLWVELMLPTPAALAPVPAPAAKTRTGATPTPQPSKPTPQVAPAPPLTLMPPAAVVPLAAISAADVLPATPSQTPAGVPTASNTPSSVTSAPVLPPVPPPVAAPAPPQRLAVASSAVRYRALPPFEVPLASRRAGEHGVVWLRVVVSKSGEPLQVRVQRSSGFVRLDEQAVWAMRQARFQPHTDDGVAVEIEVVAPVEYPLE